MSNVTTFPAHIATNSDQASDEIAATQGIKFDLQNMEMLRDLLGNLHGAVLQLAQDLVRQRGQAQPVVNSSGVTDR